MKSNKEFYPDEYGFNPKELVALELKIAALIDNVGYLFSIEEDNEDYKLKTPELIEAYKNLSSVMKEFLDKADYYIFDKTPLELATMALKAQKGKDTTQG